MANASAFPQSFPAPGSVGKCSISAFPQDLSAPVSVGKCTFKNIMPLFGAPESVGKCIFRASSQTLFQHFPKTFLHLYLWGNALSKTSCNFLAHLNLWGNAFPVHHPRACQRLKMAAAWLVI